MGKVTRLVLKIPVIFFFINNFISFCSIDFDSRFSTIRVRSGATLSITSPISNFSGTLARYSGGTITGENITFVEGIFEDLGSEILMSAVLDPDGTIYMSGSDTLRAAPSRVLQAIAVSGSANRIEGAPVFSEDITLQDSSSTVTFAVQSNVSSDIILNGGTIRLENDLSFVNEKSLTGIGIIDGNGYRLLTGSKPFTWDSSVYWQDGSNFELRADKMDLGSTFTFDGTTSVSGNGNVIDLETGGRIVVTPGSTLHLNDITLKGIGTGEGQLVLMGSDSELQISNVNFELTSDLTTTIGGILVKSPSTFIVKDYTWTFDTLATITIDGVTLWKDNADAEDFGDVAFGAPQANFLTLVSSGTVKFASFSSANVTSRLSVLESCCEEVDSRVDLLETEMDDLETSTGELISIIDSLDSYVDTIESRVEVLETCCDELKTSTGELISIIDSLDSYVDTIVSRVDLLETEVDDLETSTGELISIIDSLDSYVDTIVSRVDLLETEMDDLETSTGELISIIDSLDSYVDTIESRVEVLETCCDELKTSTGELISIIDSLDSYVDTIVSRVDLLETEMDDLETSTGELISIIDSLDSYVDTIVSRVDLLETEVDDLETSTGELISIIDSLDSYVDTIESRVEVLETCCDELKTSTGELISIIDSLDSYVDTIVSRVDLLETEMDDLETSTGELISIIDSLDSYVDTIVSRVDLLETEMDDLETSTGELISIIDSLDSYVDTIESRVEVLETCCDELKTSTGELISIIDSLDSYVDTIVSRVDLLETEVDDLETSTGELISIIDSLDSYVDTIESRVEVLETCCDELKTSTGELISLIDSLDSYVDTIVSRVDLLETEVDDLETSTGELISIIDSLDSYVDTIESRVEVLETCCDELKTSTGELISLIDSLDSYVDTIESRMDVMESCCDEMKTSTGELISLIDSLDSYVDTIESRMDVMESCCEAVWSEIDNIETGTGITTNKLISRIEFLESCCEEVKTSTGELQDQIDDCCGGQDCIYSITSDDTYFVPGIIPAMMPGVDSAVVFRFEPCWGDERVPRLIFDAGNLPGGEVVLASAARLVFQGEGIIELRDGVSFNFGTELLKANWPHVVVEERAMMIPVENATINFYGNSKIKVRDAGMIFLDKASHFIFGDLETDQFDIDVDAVGSIIVDHPNALVTFQHSIFDIHFSRSSLLSILQGRVEFNSNQDVYEPGTLSFLKFSEGANIEVQRPNGLLRLSPNLDDSLVDFDNRTGVIDGGGHKLFGSGDIQFIDFDNGINTTLRLQENFFQAEDTIVEMFLELALVLKSTEAIIYPSDLDILVRLGDAEQTLAAIDPRRTGSVYELQEGDHDIAYEFVDQFGQGQFPIIGRDLNGDFFEIDQNAIRTTIQ